MVLSMLKTLHRYLWVACHIYMAISATVPLVFKPVVLLIDPFLTIFVLSRRLVDSTLLSHAPTNLAPS